LKFAVLVPAPAMAAIRPNIRTQGMILCARNRSNASVNERTEF
jgi:hypothetical protein